ncbi:hypothetical protein B4U79_16606 [Dinothrombium tinctorium]|uniref:SKP1 component dimerisation domain-containing protein n=1 Tax=Dinothrombium tinctorium TaxID=1965070 RepID=A0A443QHR4_9ACAR|nr:hypothetical protein B4U79_16606 [Dinothrombium tinctorium]
MQQTLNESELTPWESNFVDLDADTLLELVVAADTLCIPNLLSLCCNKLNSMLKGKSREQIIEEFGIESFEG